MSNEIPPPPMCLVRSPTLLGDPNAKAPDFDDLMNLTSEPTSVVVDSRMLMTSASVGGWPGKLKIDPERAIESVMVTHGWIIVCSSFSLSFLRTPLCSCSCQFGTLIYICK